MAGSLEIRSLFPQFGEGRAISEQPHERSEQRSPIHAEVQLRRSGALNFAVELHDLSVRGCRTEFVERPRIGEVLWVKLGELAPIESTVRWVDGFEGGLEFNQPMNARVFEDVLRRMGRP